MSARRQEQRRRPLEVLPTWAVARLAPLHGGDLGHDREGDFGGTLRADVEADWGADALNSGHGNPSLEQAFNALCMRLATPQCSDIEGIGGKGVDQRRIVDLRVVGERDQRGAGIDADLGKRLVRPFTRDLGIAETLLRQASRRTTTWRCSVSSR